MIYAEERSSNTQFELGQMFRKAEYNTRDYHQAAEWFSLSAKQGNSDAQYKVGLMYARGLGVSVDYIKSYAWLKVAASQGSEKALYNLKKISQKIPANHLEDAHTLSRRYYEYYVAPFTG